MHPVPFNRLRVSNKIMQNVRFVCCQNHEVEQEKLHHLAKMTNNKRFFVRVFLGEVQGGGRIGGGVCS